MAKKPKDSGAKVELTIIDPAESIRLTLSEAWHYSFDAAEDLVGTWVGPFETREALDEAVNQALGQAAADAVSAALTGGK